MVHNPRYLPIIKFVDRLGLEHSIRVDHIMELKRGPRYGVVQTERDMWEVEFEEFERIKHVKGDR